MLCRSWTSINTRWRFFLEKNVRPFTEQFTDAKNEVLSIFCHSILEISVHDAGMCDARIQGHRVSLQYHLVWLVIFMLIPDPVWFQLQTVLEGDRAGWMFRFPYLVHLVPAPFPSLSLFYCEKLCSVTKFISYFFQLPPPFGIQSPLDFPPPILPGSCVPVPSTVYITGDLQKILSCFL